MFVSPVFQQAFNIQCRFEESCSHYAERMIQEKGLLVSFYFIFKRIIKCSKWG